MINFMKDLLDKSILFFLEINSDINLREIESIRYLNE